MEAAASQRGCRSRQVVVICQGVFGALRGLLMPLLNSCQGVLGSEFP